MVENAIDDAEDYSRSADAEGKGENGESGEPRTFPQDPQAVTNILDERFDEAHASRIAMFFFKLFHSAEFQPRAAPGFRCRQAGLDELRDLLLEMKAQLLVDFSLDTFPAEERTRAQQQVIPHGPLLSCLHLKFHARSAT